MGRKKVVQNMIEEMKNPKKIPLNLYYVGVKHGEEIMEYIVKAHRYQVNGYDKILDFYRKDGLKKEVPYAAFKDWVFVQADEEDQESGGNLSM